MDKVEFTKEKLSDGTNFEWCKHEMGGQEDLVFHFFLGGKNPSPEFFEVLKRAVHNTVQQDTPVETSYSKEFDGHDLVISSINGWKFDSTRRALIRSIEREINKMKG